jgi:hypothetical protein
MLSNLLQISLSLILQVDAELAAYGKLGDGAGDKGVQVRVLLCRHGRGKRHRVVHPVSPMQVVA